MYNISKINSFTSTQDKLNKLIDSNEGDLFLTCNQVTNKSNILFNKAEGSIMSSEAIRWAITEEEPDELDERIERHRRQSFPKTTYMKNLLSYIDNDDITQSVLDSYSESLKIGHVIFDYALGLSEENKTKVRVLTRMCWYHKYEY